MAPDTGTSSGRATGICAKYSTTTPPTSNTAADAPTGIGDLCVYVSSNSETNGHIPVSQITLYRCSAYTNTTTFTWSQIT